MLESAGISSFTRNGDSNEALLLLSQEIETGRVVLVRDNQGQLVRQMNWVQADVLYRSPQGELFQLVVQRQVFKDGYERLPDSQLAISKRLEPFEIGSECVMRQVRFGLNILGPVRVRSLGLQDEVRPSDEYSGLPGLYTTYNYVVTLDDRQFKMEGYVESQDDVETFYVWQSVQASADDRGAVRGGD